MPGIDLLGYAFKQEGFWVVQGGDVIFGGDVRNEHYPPGKFDGIISGPPCQCFSRLAHMVRHNGYEPKFGNLIPEFERCCLEAWPAWWLMENVPDAPLPMVAGYAAWSTLLNNRQLGEVQNRVRRWTFGVRGTKRKPLMIETVALEPIQFEYAATGGSQQAVPIAMNRGMKIKAAKSRLPFNTKSANAFAELCRKQGLPAGFDLPGFTVEGKCKAVGNGVPLAMGRALAKAVKEATEVKLAAAAGEGRDEHDQHD